jgi:hypothetical protein
MSAGSTRVTRIVLLPIGGEVVVVLGSVGKEVAGNAADAGAVGGWGEDSLRHLHQEQQGSLGLPANQCLSTKYHRCASASPFAWMSRQSTASSVPRGFEAALARL